MNKTKQNKNIDLVETSEKSTTARRTFLKKAVYAAPTLVTLGYLTRPTNTQAGLGDAGNQSKIPDPPTW